MKTGFFEELPGEKSMMRLMCFLSLIVALVAAAFMVVTDQLNANGMALICALLMFAFAPKAAQKYIENKYNFNEPTK